MKLKSLFLAGVLAILTISVAAAKTYDVTFFSPTKAGSLQLKAGEYRISVNGNKVTFTEVGTQKSVSTDVKVETGDKKFDETKVETVTEGGAPVVKDIGLAGSKITLDF